MRNLSIILMLIFALYSKSYSQDYFDCTFGKSQNEVGQKLLLEDDTTLVLFGWGAEYSFYFVKSNLSGDTILTKTYDFDYFNSGTDIIRLPDNEYILIGENGGVIKINENGEVQWTRHYTDYSFTSGTICNDTTFVLTGSKPVFSHIDTVPDYGIDSIFYSDIIMKQISFQGNAINELSYNFVDDDFERGNDIFKTSNGDIIITGYSYTDGMPNLFLVRLDSELNTLNDTVYSYDGIYVGNEIFENSSNQLIITGEKYDLTKKRKDILVTKIDNLGNILWEQQIDLWKDSEELYCSGIGKSIIETGNGNIYVFGNLSDGTNGADQIRDLFLIKMNNNGDTLFTKILDNAGNKMSGSLIEINENKFAMIGSTDYITNGGYDFYLILSDSLGNFDATTGIYDREIQVSNFIYPNPASNFISIDLENIKSIEIIDLQGRLQKRIVGNQRNLWIGDIPSGLYVIQVKTTNKEFSKKIIIK